MLRKSTGGEEWPNVGMLKAAIVVVAPLAVKPENFRLFVICREKDCSEVLVRGSARSIEEGEGFTE